MRAMHEAVAGIDVHQKKLAICVLVGPVSLTEPHREQSTYGTTTKELKSLGLWLLEQKVTHVFMESTSQYWCPVWNVLESYGFELILANPQRIKGIPGRKTDQNDAQWIAELGRMGLIPKSYMPRREIQDFRRLTRTRSRLVNQRTTHRNRIHNVLQQANIKLTSYLSDIFSGTGKVLIQALIDGEVIDLEFVKQTMSHRGRNFKATAEQIFDALDGSFSTTQLEELDVHFHIIQSLDEEILRLEQSIEAMTSQFQETYEKLIQIPGVSRHCAAVILSEIGDNVASFPDVKHLAKWAGLCPGSYESAGVVKSSHITQGNRYLKVALYHAGRTAAHSKSKTFSEFYARIARKGSPQKAVIACSHKVLRIVYQVLQNHIDYNLT